MRCFSNGDGLDSFARGQDTHKKDYSKPIKTSQLVRPKSSFQRVGDKRKEPALTKMDELFIEAYGAKKTEVLQKWLIMSSKELDEECAKYGLEAPEGYKEKFHALVDHVKQFELNYKQGEYSMAAVKAQGQERVQAVFGSGKQEVVAEWRMMTIDQLKQACEDYGLDVKGFDGSRDSYMVALLQFMEQVFKNEPSKIKEAPASVPDVETVESKFGMTKQQKIDMWLEMTNDELKVECKLYNLPESDKHFQNIQNLFNYIKTFKEASKPQGKIQFEKQMNINPQKQGFYKKLGQEQKQNPNLDKQVLDKAQSEVNSNLGNMFSRMRSIQQATNVEKDIKKHIRKIMEEKRQYADFAQVEKAGGVIHDETMTNYERINPQRLFASIRPNPDKLIQKKKLNIAVPDLDQKERSEYIKAARDSGKKYEDLVKKYNQSELNRFGYVLNQLKSLTVDQNVNLKFKEMKENKDITREVLLDFGCNNAHMLDSANKQSLMQVVQSLMSTDADHLRGIRRQSNWVDMIYNKPGLFEPKFAIHMKKVVKEENFPRFPTRPLDFKELVKLGNIAQTLSQNDPSLNKDIYIQDNLLNYDFETQMPLDKIKNLNNLHQEFGLLYLIPNSLLPESLLEHQTNLIKHLLERNQDYNKIAGGAFTNQQMLYLVKRATSGQLLQDRDLQKKVRAAVTEFNFSRWNKQQAHQLFECLNRSPSKEWADEGKIDTHFSHIIEQSPRTFMNMNNPEELNKCLKTIEFVYKTNPLTFKDFQSTCRYMVMSVIRMNQKFNVDLNSLIKISTIISPSSIKPAFMFDAMIKHDQSFKSDVERRQLAEFVDVILRRLKQHSIQFDHLKDSISRMHSAFESYTTKTFLLFRKIIDDLTLERGEEAQVRQDINNKDFDIINAILAEEQVSNRLFSDSETSLRQLLPIFQQQLAQIKSEDTERKPIEGRDEQTQVLTRYHNLFKSIKNVKYLYGFNQELEDVSTELIKLQIKNLSKDLNLFVAPTAAKSEPKSFRSEDFPIEQFLSLNQSLLRAIKSQSTSADLMQHYNSELPNSQIVDGILMKKLFGHKKDFDEFKLKFQELEHYGLENQETIKLLDQSIFNLTWSKMETRSGQLITHFQETLAQPGNTFRKVKTAHLIEKYLSKMSNARSLHGRDLVGLFELVDNLEKVGTVQHMEQFDDLLINVSSNLKTIGVKLLERSSTNAAFLEENERRIQHDRDNKKAILSRYYSIYVRNKEIFERKDISLAPLSSVIEELVNDFDDQQVLNCLKMLGTHSINNYTQDMISKLYEQYSQPLKMTQMHKQKPGFFYDFAAAWPYFLRNNSILTELTKIKNTTENISEMNEKISILTKKNVLHPHLLDMFLASLIKLTDKQQVKRYMQQYIHSCAYFGYTKNLDLEMLTQIFRRLYKDPKNVDASELLDFLLLLSLSENQHWSDFDIKSQSFVLEALDLVEHLFTGTLSEKRVNEQGKEFKLEYFKQIPSERKTYSKQLVRMLPEDDALVEQTLANNAPITTSEVSGSDSEAEAENSASDSDADEPTHLLQKGELDEALDMSEGDATDALVTDIDTDTGNNTDGGEESKRTKKSYDRIAKDSQYQEDLEYLKFRNKTFGDLGKRGKHKVLYSNIDTLNFQDINSIDVAKAWTILLHFRNKTIQSMLYEEFNSISRRNAIGKTQGHRLFNKMYVQLMEKSYDIGYSLYMSQVCENTGWPIDILIKPRSFNDGLFSGSKKETQPTAVYFLLSEELCYNAQSGQEEPLGLQKMMLRHIKKKGNTNVQTMSENDVYQNTDHAVASLIQEIQSQSTESQFRQETIADLASA